MVFISEEMSKVPILVKVKVSKAWTRNPLNPVVPDFDSFNSIKEAINVLVHFLAARYSLICFYF